MKKAIFKVLTIAIVLLLLSAPAYAESDLAEASTEAEAKTETEVTIMFTGDLMCQPSQQAAAFDGRSYDFKPTFKYVKNIFDNADFVVGNLETLISESLPLSKDMNRLQSKPYLNSPAAYLDALRYAGFDAFILANNHCCDGAAHAFRQSLACHDAAEILVAQPVSSA